MLVAFDSNVLTAFLNANSSASAPVGEELASFRLFLYIETITILPTVSAEAHRIPAIDLRWEHLNWVWYHFPEAQLGQESERILARTQVLVPHHTQRDPDDCAIVAEAEASSADVLATIDRRIKRLQPHTTVRLLTPSDLLDQLVFAGAQPCREPAEGHPHSRASWWRV
jgi:predicted nucleic acid-binding protein